MYQITLLTPKSESFIKLRRNGAVVETYSYDVNGNRISNGDQSASYDEQDRIIRQGGVTYEFDSDGFLTRRGNDTFEYSARGELLKATLGNGDEITYAYDGLGRRVARTVVSEAYESGSSGTYQYLYGNPNNPFQVTATREPGGTLSSYYYDQAGRLFAIERDGSRYYVATDQVGTPRVLFDDDSGEAFVLPECDAFGNPAEDSEFLRRMFLI